MLVAVGSDSNVDDPDTHPNEKNRANILAMIRMAPACTSMPAGIRNPVGIAINPKTGELWCSVNERDGSGDNLVPDYITHVQRGRFLWLAVVVYRRPPGSAAAGTAPELKDKTIVPDVLLQPHNVRWK